MCRIQMICMWCVYQLYLQSDWIYSETSAKMFILLLFLSAKFSSAGTHSLIFSCRLHTLQYTVTQVHVVCVCLSAVDLVLYVSAVP